MFVPSASAGSESPPAHAEQMSAEATAVQSALAELSTRQRLAVKNRCVGAGIDNWTDPGPEGIDRVLTIIKEVAS